MFAGRLIFYLFASIDSETGHLYQSDGCSHRLNSCSITKDPALLSERHIPYWVSKRRIACDQELIDRVHSSHCIHSFVPEFFYFLIWLSMFPRCCLQKPEINILSLIYASKMKKFYCVSLVISLWCISARGQNTFIDTHNLTEVISTTPACAVSDPQICGKRNPLFAMWQITEKYSKLVFFPFFQHFPAISPQRQFLQHAYAPTSQFKPTSRPVSWRSAIYRNKAVCESKIVVDPQDILTTSGIASTNQALCEGFHIEEGSRHLLAIVVIVSSITFPFVFLRIWSRLSFTSLGLGLDDGAMLVAAAS